MPAGGAHGNMLEIALLWLFGHNLVRSLGVVLGRGMGPEVKLYARKTRATSSL